MFVDSVIVRVHVVLTIFLQKMEKRFGSFLNLKEGTRVCENVCALYLMPVSRVIAGKKLVPVLSASPPLNPIARIVSVAL